MNISYDWLSRYCHPVPPPDKVADLLTGCGLEVEGIETWQTVEGGLQGVVIGQVLTCEKHPNSDHLSLTTVDTGTGTPLRIVCGASNVAAGQKVAVATVGTTLRLGDKEVRIAPTKIRGEVSEGMICAEDELGLGDSHDGIMVLDPGARPGMPAAEYFGIVEDKVFAIGLTPNRVDAASHTGTARDLVAVLNHLGRESAPGPEKATLVLPDVSGFTPDHTREPFEVIIEDPSTCRRYSGLTLSGIQVRESPDWLKHRLLSIGLRPVNNVVDITNFVLMELGQPLHAFDADRIRGGRVLVKKFPEGTPFTTLDGTERKLSADDLLIADSEGPMCLAGIFGGLGSGVTEATTRIFLESACFDARHIRKSSRLHGLQTDASFRFERGSDPSATVYALQRAALMIREIAGGEIASEVVDVCPEPLVPATIHLSWKNLDRLAGKVLDRGMVKSLLSDLGIKITREEPEEGAIVAEIPFAKVDVTREADLIEEILRIYGYNNIEPDPYLRAALSCAPYPDPDKIRNTVSDFLTANGFFEIMSNSLTRSAYYENNPDFPAGHCVRILNPISRELDTLRGTLLYGMLEAVAYNQNRKSPDLKLFEFGTVYRSGSTGSDPLPGYHEETRLGIMITGRMIPQNWNSPDDTAGFHHLKGFLEGALQAIGLDGSRFETRPAEGGYLAQGLAYLDQGQEVIVAGLLTESLSRSFDCRQPVLYASLNWTTLISGVEPGRLKYQGIPRFPEVRRDLALVINRDVTFSMIEAIAYKAEKNLLKKVGLFDIYEGEKIESDKKQYALSFILQSDERTLTDQEIDRAMGRILDSLVKQVQARLR